MPQQVIDAVSRIRKKFGVDDVVEFFGTIKGTSAIYDEDVKVVAKWVFFGNDTKE